MLPQLLCASIGLARFRRVGSAHGDTHPAGAGCTGATVKGAHGDTHPADEDHSGAAVEGAHGDTHPAVANCAGAKVDDGARGDTHPAVADARETGSSLRGTERWYGAISSSPAPSHLSVTLATASLDPRGGEGAGGQSAWSRKTPSLSAGGPAVRIRLAPARSLLRTRLSGARPIDDRRGFRQRQPSAALARGTG